MRTAVKEVDGIDWNDGAVCNCTWSGPLLADVLAHIGVTLSPEEEEAHVTFNCFQTDVQDDVFYGGSIPLSRCLDPSKKVLLALDMNGCPLTINHGFPLRVVAPGIAGARWTKWLDRITIQHDESENYYQQRDYKILPPYVTTPEQALEAWPLVPAIQGMPINSIIACPEPDSAPAVSKRGELRICGYALPQEDDGPVVGVEVSCDLGKSWAPAEIVFPRKTELGEEKYKWAWAIWEYWMPADLVGGITPETKIWSRARDKGGNMQDGSVPWNYRGVAYNAYGETKGLRVQGVEKAERRVTGV